MTYITIPLQCDYKNKTSTGEVANDTQKAIAQYAAQGYVLIGIYSRSITVKPGCLASLRKKVPTPYVFDVAVFGK
jgi:hypothetical protein